jgi:hypothetical protein
LQADLCISGNDIAREQRRNFLWQQLLFLLHIHHHHREGPQVRPPFFMLFAICIVFVDRQAKSSAQSIPEAGFLV